MKFIANVDYYENIAKQTGTHHTDLTGWINDNLNRYGQWEIKTLDDIKPGEKYAVFIDVFIFSSIYFFFTKLLN